MADGGISGLGGAQQPFQQPGKVGQSSSEKGTFKNLAVTVVPNSQSAVAEARTLSGEAMVVGRKASSYYSEDPDAKNTDEADSTEKSGTEKYEEKKNKEGGVRIVNNVEGMLGNRQYKGYEARLRRMAQFKRVADYIEFAEQYFDDPTEVYMAMRAAQENFYKGSADPADDTRLKDFAAGLNKAAGIYYQENGPDIQAGINLLIPKSEVDIYRDKVLRFQTVPETFEAIMTESSGNKTNFKDKLTFLIETIGTDLEAARPTLEPVQLNKILQELQRVQYCQGLHEACDLLIRNMNELYNLY